MGEGTVEVAQQEKADVGEIKEMPNGSVTYRKAIKKHEKEETEIIERKYAQESAYVKLPKREPYAFPGEIARVPEA